MNRHAHRGPDRRHRTRNVRPSRPSKAIPLPRRQRGAMSVAILFSLLAACAVAAFSIDLGQIFLAQYELQNAADAAALAGADALLGVNSGPNWSLAQSKAASAVGLNSSNGVQLSSATVQTGYWNVTGTPASLQATTITPGTYDEPAVQVTISRAAGLNGGTVSFFFAPLFGVKSGAVSATAVAVASAPGYIGAGGLFPVAMGQCVFNQYWNAQTGAPTTDPSTGQPYEFQIGSGASYGGCEAGQWTSFQTDANDVPTVRSLMQNGNPTPLAIGDSIWIEPGVKTTLYSSVPVPADVLVPVVQDVMSGTTTIVAFAEFHIDASVGGSGKYIQGHLETGFAISAATAQSGPYYGAYVPARLAL